MKSYQMAVNICGVDFKNPVIAASGTFGFGAEYSQYVDLNLLGGISVKGLTLKPRKGNPPPRIAETPSGILNSVGLQNPGVDFFIEEELPTLLRYDTRVIANINGNTIEEYCLLAEKLSHVPVDLIELNISCPNVKMGGAAFGAKPEMVYEVVESVKRCIRQPLIVKLTPNTLDITETAAAAEQAGADGISLINTLLGMAVDVRSRRPVLANVTGGLSGPAVKPVALRMVWQVYNTVKIPVIGMGGIMSGEDAVEFMLAGAAAVAVGTANLVNPTSCVEVLRGIERYMGQYQIHDINEVIGGLLQ